MLRITLIVVGILVVLVGGVLAYAATKPDIFEVQRSATINAPFEKIYPMIDNLHTFVTWSPFEKDPAIKRTYSGAESGPGAIYEWDGDKNVGAGRVEVGETQPPSKVTMKLDMFRPFEAHNLVEFTLEPRGETTIVTWAMRGRVPYVAKIAHVFLNMDKMVGGDFEIGLANLKTMAEK